MNRLYPWLTGLCTLALSAAQAQTSPSSATTPAMTKPPVAASKPKQLASPFGTRTDNYYWLNERENPEVLSYLNAENAYFEQQMAPVKALQETLFQEIKGRIKEQDESVPYRDNGYYYYTRYEQGGEYPIYCRKKGSLTAPEEVLLNGNEMGKGKAYFQIGGFAVSDDNQTLAYAADTVSRRLYTLRFRNLATGKRYPEKIINASGDAVWAADHKTVFYTQKDPATLLPYRVYRHTLGTDPKQDVLVYEEKDNTYYTGVSRSKSHKYIFLHMGSTMSSETRFLEAAKPTEAFKTFLPREADHLYEVEHFGNDFYVRSNAGAPNFRLLKTPVTNTAKKAWQEVIPHRKDVFLKNMELFKDYLVLGERKEGLLQLRVIRWKDKQEHYLNFGEPTYTAIVSVNPEFDTPVLRYGYSSLTTPTSTFDYDMTARTRKLMKEQAVLGGFRKEDYVTERAYATATDGTRIPLSIVYKKGFKKDGTAPLLQYAYGSYGSSTDATFSAARLSLLDRGFAYVICHIRGGQEMGRQWYEDGKKLKKMNTFTDFTDCSKFLIDQKFTSASKLFALGGSAGGLLMGAVVNMHPEYYKGVIAAVPFVDVVTTMMDSSIPLTTGEYDEWGNPNQKEYYNYMLSYSPYDQVKAHAYPNMLVTTGLHDSQVQYFEPAKWVAKLRTLKTDNNLLLLHTDMAAGHGGASGRFKSINDVARQFAFMLLLLDRKS
ncbi:oligopeptidase B [Hymenobacter daecheongensis DSM 21074]|uniref:Proline-specific endopeptidase n=1 Tax=Hymenobacter daecheongensis DSM 21074 TaxID=1121955 RepID=A0A1M6E3B7_9BACT|nr:S9 family peptidase [Hymenobacter daecheongensis]SHI79879.1 oligopeptidase B [Hymenobacter daecheongensis DSM 21074]